MIDGQPCPMLYWLVLIQLPNTTNHEYHIVVTFDLSPMLGSVSLSEFQQVPTHGFKTSQIVECHNGVFVDARFMHPLPEHGDSGMARGETARVLPEDGRVGSEGSPADTVCLSRV